MSSIGELDGEDPITRLTRDMGDISFLWEFGWYEFVWFSTPQHLSKTMENKRLGKYCRPSINDGDAMSSRILMDQGRFVNRTSVFPIKEEEWSTDSFKQRAADLEAKVKERLKERYNPPKPSPEDDEDAAMPTHEPYQPVDSQDEPALPELVEADEIQHEAFDRYIFARVRVLREDDWC